MKFSEIDRKQWGELQPYLDTCLLPISGVTGSESPWEATDKLAKLGERLEWLEQPFYGRIVTYPAMHYVTDMLRFTEMLDGVARNAKQSGFRYVVAVAADPDIEIMLRDRLDNNAVDLFLGESDFEKGDKDVQSRIRNLWDQPINMNNV